HSAWRGPTAGTLRCLTGVVLACGCSPFVFAGFPSCARRSPMAKFSDQFEAFCGLASQLAKVHQTDAVLYLLDRPTDWKRLHVATDVESVVIASDVEEALAGAADEGFETIFLN